MFPVCSVADSLAFVKSEMGDAIPILKSYGARLEITRRIATRDSERPTPKSPSLPTCPRKTSGSTRRGYVQVRAPKRKANIPP